MIEIIAPSATIEVKFVPRATINIGPSATLGIELSTTRYGSKIFERMGDHHKRAARTVPISVPRIKPRTVSASVTPMFTASDPSSVFSISKFQIFEGELNRSGSIHLF